MAVSISGTSGITLPSGADITGKNQCTAWCNFDGTTTPPTIRDSYNVSQVIRTATGRYDVYFEDEMDNANYATLYLNGEVSTTYTGKNANILAQYSNKTQIVGTAGASETTNQNMAENYVAIFGGKNNG